MQPHRRIIVLLLTTSLTLLSPTDADLYSWWTKKSFGSSSPNPWPGVTNNGETDNSLNHDANGNKDHTKAQINTAGPDKRDGTGASGEVAWVAGQAGVVPANSVLGGSDSVNHENLYVCRAHHGGAVTPGKLVSSHRVCYVAWGGREHGKTNYEALTGTNFKWVPTVEGNIPPNAVEGGTTENGEILYIGRAEHDGSITIGKVQASHEVCYIPYGGRECIHEKYDILVHQ